MPILGASTRSRKIQVGNQGSNLLSASTITTPVAATRVLPYRGVPDVELNWTHPDVDTGSLFKTVAPFRRRADLTQPMDGQLAYNDLPYLFGSILQGITTPTGGGTAKTWTYQPATDGSPLSILTVQFGDSVDGVGESVNDWYQFVGGLEESLTLEGPEEFGPLNVSAQWRYADANSGSWTDNPLVGTVPTAALSVDNAPTWVYLDDLELFIDPTFGAIGTTKISDAVRGLTLSIENNLDPKPFANGSNTRFATQAYGRGEIAVSLEVTYEKTTQTVGTGSQSDTVGLINADSQYVELRFTARELAQAGVPYSLNVRIPLWNVKRTEAEINNNAVIRIRGDAFFDSSLGYAIRAVVVNTLSAY